MVLYNSGCQNLETGFIINREYMNYKDWTTTEAELSFTHWKVSAVIFVRNVDADQDPVICDV